MTNFVPKPWTAIEKTEREGKISLKVWGREYALDKSLLFTSITSQGEDLLRAPIKIFGIENGEEFCAGEAVTHILNAKSDTVSVISTTRSKSFVFNTALEFEYDGFCKIDLKVMPVGYTVNEVFGVEKNKQKDFKLERLWIDIPLKRGVAENFHYWPTYWKTQSPIFEKDPIEFSSVSMSRAIPSSMSMGFKSLVYLGNGEVGLGFSAESDEQWNYEKDKAIEILCEEEGVTLRIHLLDAQPKKWKEYPENPNFLKQYGFLPVTFTFALHATPIKPLDCCIYPEKTLHIDCFKKIQGDYYEYLLKEECGEYACVLDKIASSGVKILYLHEKWNKIQNYWEIVDSDKPKIKTIIEQCHKRGIKVIPYFGYEISSLNPLWSEISDKVLQSVGGQYPNNGGWYRVPQQRAYVVCYGSEWKNLMLEGVKKMMAEYDFDGIYLDSMLYPTHCANESHGCGYRDESGNLHVTYPVFAIREFMKNLREVMGDKIISAHASNCLNISSMGLCDVIWDGEQIQTYLHQKGVDALPLDYMRAEYDFKGIGVFYEFLIYTFDNWSFRDGLSLALIHGMLPKPNSIDEPLEIMEKIWKAYDAFPFNEAEFYPYHKNSLVSSSNDNVKASTYLSKDGKTLTVVANPTGNEERTTIDFGSGASVIDAISGEECHEKIDTVFKKCETRIFVSKTK